MRWVLVICVACAGCGDDDGAPEDGGATDAGAGDRDAGPLADTGPAMDGGGPGGDAGECVRARRLWFDDFETGDYSRWTGMDYGNDWRMGICHANGFSTDQAVSATHSHRSEITCATTESHRGYGGVQFDGDTPLPGFTNMGTGIDAPYGVVNTYWSWLDVPYAFQDGRWFSFWTVNNDCGWGDRVITLGLEDPSNRLTPAHILNTGGTVDFAPGAPTFPLRTWVRTTIYVNYVEGEIHIWQDGAELLHGTFSRGDTDICQWHWGAYASQDNDDIVLYEDDNSIWKLEEPWTDWSREPYFGVDVPACD